ncbi:hypothetical protein KKB68_02655 [Patescibacteria group bacterium]|nr:hypothetical protein [Patescibacteria group bacterium]
MEKKKLPKSFRKFIRKEKARIRRDILDTKEQEKLIQEIYLVKKPVEQNKDKEKKSKVTSKQEKSS